MTSTKGIKRFINRINNKLPKYKKLPCDKVIITPAQDSGYNRIILDDPIITKFTQDGWEVYNIMPKDALKRIKPLKRLTEETTNVKCHTVEVYLKEEPFMVEETEIAVSNNQSGYQLFIQA